MPLLPSASFPRKLGDRGKGKASSRHPPGFGWRYSIVLVNTSATALLVRSTFCRTDKVTQHQ